MNVDPHTLLAIVVMAVITYATRISGVALAGRLKLSPRSQAAFDAVPPAVLIALVAPTALVTGWAETLAAVAVAIAAMRLPLLGVIAVGVVAVVAFRQMGL